MALLLAGAFTSCADDYLDTAPETEITDSQMTATVDAAQAALVGICESMWCPYVGLNDFYQVNGEAYINHRFDDAFGPDHHIGFTMLYGPEIVTGGAPWRQDNIFTNSIVWKYCYNLIMQANKILQGIDDADGDAAQRDFIKAQLLTFRAHGYTKLMQYFAPRWEDSNNGDVYCAVLKTSGTIENAPLCTMNDVFKLIYSDLDQAIELYQNSKQTRGYKWMPDLSVAYGVYARAAMIIHDFEKAQEVAHNATLNYKVMSNDEYLSGFYLDNNDLMWTSTPSDEMGYYGEYNWQSCNGPYDEAWNFNDAIDMSLYNQLDPNDIRRLCYFTPDKIKYMEDIDEDYNPAGLTEDAFWNDQLVTSLNGCDISNGAYEAKKGVDNWGLYNVGAYFAWYYTYNIFTGNLSEAGEYDASNKNDIYTRYAYIKSYDNNKSGKIRTGSKESVSLNTLVFGAQFKIWCALPYGHGYYPFMRATEIKLLEAEAAYYNGDVTTCNRILEEINGQRIAGYKFSGSGQALLDEIRLCRRIELWGEGHNWTDFKRWNLPIERKAWVAGDPNSGNWQPGFGIDTPVKANSGWRMRIPASEVNYNSAIDKNLLDESYNYN